MSMDSIPILVVFAGTILIVAVAIEVGYRLGLIVHRRTEDEKESAVSAIAGAILGLTAFMLAFTFGIVTNRYDARKALVRDEANAIGTAYLRTFFLSEPNRSKSRELFPKYLDARLAASQSRDLDQIHKLMIESDQIQRQLWAMGVAEARKDMNSDIGALYIDSLNNCIDIQALRVAIALQARIPAGIWLISYLLVILGTLAVGYQTAIAGSQRSWSAVFLALSFSIVIGLIVSLDRPQSTFIPVSQQPLMDVRASIAEGPADPADPGAKP
jgi:hypothetical protein